MKTMFALAILSSVVATPALAEMKSFTRDGLTYRYEVKDAGDAKIVSGYDQFGKSFQLKVRNGRVSGRYAGAAMAFAAPTSDFASTASTGSPLATR